MTDSILTSIKQMLGIEEEYEFFDADIIILINSALSTLTQLGVGPEEGYSIEDKESTWTDYLDSFNDINMVKTYVYLKTKLIFDTPSNSAVIEAYKSQISECEWRIRDQIEVGRNGDGYGTDNISIIDDGLLDSASYLYGANFSQG